MQDSCRSRAILNECLSTPDDYVPGLGQYIRDR
jgi:hypothetical protein